MAQDAARLMKDGELVIFGSAALAFWLREPPQSRDVDVWTEPRERGALIEALMGELSWYHDKFSIHAEVWGPETFKAPPGWRARARVFSFDEASAVRVVCAHPHDVVLAKLERLDPKDQEQIQTVLRQLPMSTQRLDELLREYDQPRDAQREARFQASLAWLRRELTS
ncbi:MAG: hypothetical protein IT380_00930 [Myxococcales bacterium]|nr:hypothetical protein [Myxococcales bacterium]